MVAPAQKMAAEELYRRGRSDFVESVVDALGDPSIQEMPMTVSQFVRILRECTKKCDEIISKPLSD